MSNLKVVFTNRALMRMKQYGLSETQVLDSFYHGEKEVNTLKNPNMGRWSMVKKYSGYEVGVNYDVDVFGKYKIVTVWSRSRR